MSTPVKQAIHEHDVVAFVEAVDKLEGTGKWPAGTSGAVIHDFGDHKMIDVADERGETLDMPVVAVDQLKLVIKYS